MLDCLPPLAHLLRMLIEPPLHRLKDALMLPSGDPPLFAGGAAMLNRTSLAGVGPITVQDQAIFLVRVVVGEALAGRRDVNIFIPPRSGSPVCQSVPLPLSSRSSAWAA